MSGREPKRRAAAEAPPPRKALPPVQPPGGRKLNPPPPPTIRTQAATRNGGASTKPRGANRRSSVGSVLSDTSETGTRLTTGLTTTSVQSSRATSPQPEQQQGEVRPAEDAAGTKKRRRKHREEQIVFRSELHRFMHYVEEHRAFEGIVMLTILVNMMAMAMETDKKFSEANQTFFITLDLVSLIIYSAEFVIKLYVFPKGYWSSGYNRFDLCILALSYLDLIQFFFPGLFSSIGNVKFLRVLRGLRALRALRGVSFIEPLQVFISAIVATMKSAIHLLLLLFLIMYVFSIVAFNFFSDAEKGQGQGTGYWTSLPAALFSLFDWTTADNWGSFLEPLEAADNYSGRFFAVAYICVGHFIFTNLFIGIVVENLDEAQSQEVDRLRQARQRMVNRKKAVIAAKQDAERQRLLEGQMDFMRTVPQLDRAAGRVLQGLSHGDLIPMRTLACNPLWLDTLVQTTDYQEASLARGQQMHFEIARTLAEIVQRRLKDTPMRSVPEDALYPDQATSPASASPSPDREEEEDPEAYRRRTPPRGAGS